MSSVHQEPSLARVKAWLETRSSAAAGWLSLNARLSPFSFASPDYSGSTFSHDRLPAGKAGQWFFANGQYCKHWSFVYTHRKKFRRIAEKQPKKRRFSRFFDKVSELSMTFRQFIIQISRFFVKIQGL